MIRKLSLAGLVAGAAVGMALAAAPAHAGDYYDEDGVLIVNSQQQAQEATATAVSDNVNVNINVAESDAASLLEIIIGDDEDDDENDNGIEVPEI